MGKGALKGAGAGGGLSGSFRLTCLVADSVTMTTRIEKLGCPILLLALVASGTPAGAQGGSSQTRCGAVSITFEHGGRVISRSDSTGQVAVFATDRSGADSIVASTSFDLYARDKLSRGIFSSVQFWLPGTIRPGRYEVGGRQNEILILATQESLFTAQHTASHMAIGDSGVVWIDSASTDRVVGGFDFHFGVTDSTDFLTRATGSFDSRLEDPYCAAMERLVGYVPMPAAKPTLRDSLTARIDTTRWVVVFAGDSAISAIDRRSVVNLQAGVIRVWQQWIYPPKTEAGIETNSYMEREDYDCSKRRFRSVMVARYMDTKSVVSSGVTSPDSANWQDPIPGTVGEYIHEKVCSMFGKTGRGSFFSALFVPAGGRARKERGGRARTLRSDPASSFKVVP